MRFFKKIAGFLGFGKDEDIDDPNNPEDIRRNQMNNNNNNNENVVDPIQAGPRRGFSVPVQVSVERPVAGPILVPCNGDGGIQGLRWYAERLRMDEDGDIADEFFHEVSPDTLHVMQDQPKPMPRFQVKSNVRHAKVKNLQLTLDGKFQHLVECQGRLQWV